MGERYFGVAEILVNFMIACENYNQLEVTIYIPHPALQAFVVNFSTIHAVLPPTITEVVNPYPPSPFQTLFFYGNDPVSMSREGETNFDKQAASILTGPQFSRVNIKVHRQIRAVRVDFLPGALYRVTGIPMHELLDQGIDAADVFGPEIKIVNDKLQRAKDLEQCKNIVEQFLLTRVSTVRDHSSFDSAMRVLLQANGGLRIETAASLSCLSLKQFERQCRQRIGMNPKTYARILKFSKAYRLHEASPQLSWLQIAHEAGYYDQMHLIRDFKLFAGVNPSVIGQQLLSTPIRMQKDLRY